MPTWDSVAAFEADIARFEQELERETQRAAGIDMAERGRAIAARAASEDLGGDPKFSGWAPTLDTVVKPLVRGAVLHPTRSSAGPWTVAELGRNSDGGVGLFQGPGLNMRSGRTSRNAAGDIVVRGRRQRKARRWNGRTAGKATASDAYEQIEREVGPIAEKHVKAALIKRFDVS